jgi:hypothetical protein
MSQGEVRLNLDKGSETLQPSFMVTERREYRECYNCGEGHLSRFCYASRGRGSGRSHGRGNYQGARGNYQGAMRVQEVTIRWHEAVAVAVPVTTTLQLIEPML